MESWMFDLAMVSLAVLIMAVIIFKWMFSATEDQLRQAAARPRPRFERREAERHDRRRRKAAAPAGQERRVSQRR